MLNTKEAADKLTTAGFKSDSDGMAELARRGLIPGAQKDSHGRWKIPSESLDLYIQLLLKRQKRLKSLKNWVTRGSIVAVILFFAAIVSGAKDGLDLIRDYILPTPILTIVPKEPTSNTSVPVATETATNPAYLRTTTSVFASPTFVGTEVPSKRVTPIIPSSLLTEIHKDDFSDPSSGWNIGGYYCRTQYEDNLLEISISNKVFCFVSWTEIGRLDNFVIEVDALGPFLPGNSAIFGLGFGSRDSSSSGAYAFAVNAAGNCLFLEYVEPHEFGGGWTQRATGSVQDFDEDRTYHTVRAYVKHREVQGFVDGEFCARYIMPEYRSGYVGVIASALHTGLDYSSGEAYFDDYVIFKER